MHPLVVGRRSGGLPGRRRRTDRAPRPSRRHRPRSRRARPARRRRRRRQAARAGRGPAQHVARPSVAAGTGDQRRRKEQRRADQQRGRDGRQRIAGGGERGRRSVGLADRRRAGCPIRRRRGRLRSWRADVPMVPLSSLTLLSDWVTPGSLSTYSSSAGAARCRGLHRQRDQRRYDRERQPGLPSGRATHGRRTIVKVSAGIAARLAGHGSAIAVAVRSSVALALDSGGFASFALGLTAAATWIAIVVVALGTGPRASFSTGRSSSRRRALAVLAVLGALALGWSDRPERGLRGCRPLLALSRRLRARRASCSGPGSGRRVLAGIGAGLAIVSLIALASRLLGVGAGDAELVARQSIVRGTPQLPDRLLERARSDGGDGGPGSDLDRVGQPVTRPLAASRWLRSRRSSSPLT